MNDLALPDVPFETSVVDVVFSRSRRPDMLKPTACGTRRLGTVGEPLLS
jgi:hypothetical protein